MDKLPRKYIGVGDVAISKLTRKYISQVLRTRHLTYGEFTKKFESEFARIHKTKYALFCNSGTSALQAALHAMKSYFGWANGDEILVPALTFVATVNIVLQNNLKPVFVDIDPIYFDINPEKIEEKINTKTKAIIPVHIGGHPANMTVVMKLAKKYHLKVLEDSCETMFARHCGKVVGSFGDASCFSTYAAHFITTGVGGFACTNDLNLAKKIRSLFNHGRDIIYTSIEDDNVTQKEKLLKVIKARFNFLDVGYSYRATEFEAAVGLAQLKNWEDQIQKRKANAAYLTKKLQSLDKYLQLPSVRAGDEHTYMFYPIVIKSHKIKREDLVFFLEKHKIETRYLLPLLNQPVYKKLFGNIEDLYPVAKYIAHQGFYIGSHPQLTQKELDYMIETIHLFFKSR